MIMEKRYTIDDFGAVESFRVRGNSFIRINSTKKLNDKSLVDGHAACTL